MITSCSVVTQRGSLAARPIPALCRCPKAGAAAAGRCRCRWAVPLPLAGAGGRCRCRWAVPLPLAGAGGRCRWPVPLGGAGSPKTATRGEAAWLLVAEDGVRDVALLQAAHLV